MFFSRFHFDWSWICFAVDQSIPSNVLKLHLTALKSLQDSRWERRKLNSSCQQHNITHTINTWKSALPYPALQRNCMLWFLSFSVLNRQLCCSSNRPKTSSEPSIRSHQPIWIPKNNKKEFSHAFQPHKARKTMKEEHWSTCKWCWLLDLFFHSRLVFAFKFSGINYCCVSTTF